MNTNVVLMIIHYFSNWHVHHRIISVLKLKCVRMDQCERLCSLYKPSGYAMDSVCPVSLPRVVIAQQVILKYRSNDVSGRTNRFRCRRAERKALLVILLVGILIQLCVLLVRTICPRISTLKLSYR